MKSCAVLSLYIILVLLYFLPNVAFGQLGFCEGNSGESIFFEDFGSGTSNGPQLPAGVTSYNYVDGTPDDGDYTISSNTAYFDWYSLLDHTPGDTNGKSFIVNADYTAGEFYRTEITGLCENTSYEFSAWLVNLQAYNGCGGNSIPVNVKFEIWDSSDTQLLSSGDTGIINASTNPQWQEYGLVFQSSASQNSIILKMKNNGNGGCGNDLAIDDITFKTCGDLVDIVNDTQSNGFSVCSDETPVSTILTANPDNSVYQTHYYQWQGSSDGENWLDILGENSSSITINGVEQTMVYRVKVAEDEINLSNSQCNTISESFEIRVIDIPEPPISNGNMLVCDNEIEPLSVQQNDGIMVNWYDSLEGGNLLQTNSESFLATIEGTYYAEAISEDGGCLSESRTAISLTFSASPIVQDEEVILCEGEEILLNAGVEASQYLWNTGEVTSNILVNVAGIYSVEITNEQGCASTKEIEVLENSQPQISSVISDGTDIIVAMETIGDYEYSLDGLNFQLSNRFNNREGGLYRVFVNDLNGCGMDTTEHLHFYIPRYFTPNGDGQSDRFSLKGIEYYQSSEVYIFDRYGKILKSSKNSWFEWDGTVENNPLEASDYWYYVKINNQEYRGHFSLLR